MLPLLPFVFAVDFAATSRSNQRRNKRENVSLGKKYPKSDGRVYHFGVFTR